MKTKTFFSFHLFLFTISRWDFLNDIFCWIVLCFIEPPEFKDAPALKINVDRVTQEVTFVCEVTPLDTPDLQYTVQWFLNDKQLKEDTLTNTTESLLNETYITQLFYQDKVILRSHEFR